MADALPDPLVPADVDLTDFQFVPLYIEKLRKSKSWLICKRRPDLAFYLLNLWMRAWHERPAGSIESDEDVLADAAMCDPKRWPKLRGDLMRGWVKCSDGRTYHPVVAKLAIGAWAEKLTQRARTKAATEAKERKRRELEEERNGPRKEADKSPAAQRDDYRNDERNVHQGKGRESKGKGKGQGQGQGTAGSPLRSEPEVNPASGEPASRARPDRVNGSGKAHAEAKTGPCWQAYSEAYRSRWGIEPVRNAKVNADLARLIERVPAAEAPQVAAFFVRSNRGLYVAAKHATNLLLRDAEALRTEWVTGLAGTDTEARQADRTAATGNAFAPLIAEAEERDRLAGK